MEGGKDVAVVLTKHGRSLLESHRCDRPRVCHHVGRASSGCRMGVAVEGIGFAISAVRAKNKVPRASVKKNRVPVPRWNRL